MQPIVCIFCQASIPYLIQNRKYCEHLEDWHNITVLEEVQRALRESLARRESAEKKDQVTKALEPTVVNRLSLGDSTNSPGSCGSTEALATSSLEQFVGTSTIGHNVVKKQTVKSASSSVKTARVPQEGGSVITTNSPCSTSSLSKLDGSKLEKTRNVPASGTPKETFKKVVTGYTPSEASHNTPSDELELTGNKQEAKRKITQCSSQREVPKMRKLDAPQKPQQTMVVTKKLKGDGRKLSKIIKRLNSQEIEESLFKDSDMAGPKNGEKKTAPAKKENITKVLSEQEIESIFGVKVNKASIKSKANFFDTSCPKAAKLKQKMELVQPRPWFEGVPVECGACGQQVPRSHFYSRHIRTHGLKTKTDYESLYRPVPQVTRRAGEAWLCLACPGSGTLYRR